MNYKLVLIDLDDTLFDYSKAENSAFRSTFEEMGFFKENRFLKNQNSEEFYTEIKREYEKINSQLWKDLEKGIVNKEELKVIRFEKIIKKFKLEYDCQKMSEIYLKKLGEGIFPFKSTEKLCKYLHSKYKIGIVTNGIIMIGDSLEADIKGGQNAGIDTCWVNLRNNVNDTGIVPKYEVNKLEKLFEIL